MPARKRERVEPTDDWAQLQLHLDWPEQTHYELIRPVVVFGHRPLDRAEQTGVSPRSIYRKVARFDQLGLAGLFEPDPNAESKRQLPPNIRRALVQLKAEYPPFRPNELATICYVRFNRRPSSHTIQKVLAEAEPPTSVARRFPPYNEISDPVERRAAIVRLHAEGWNIASIAGYLQTSRPTVYATLKRWATEGVHGLEAQSHARHRLPLKSDLAAVEAIRKLQVNPELGAFRIYAALKQLGINLSPRTCGRILARNRKLYGLRGPEAKPREPKPMPFKAERRHQYWTVDIRYLDVHQLGGGNVYCISILENYSRVVVASLLSRTQDLSAFLQVLFEAVRSYGAPEALVSDGGSVFRAKQAHAIYQALGITKEQIALRQPWQSYIETTFNIQRRMADWSFAQAESWEELQQRHATWVANYNLQEHWAHQQRQDGRRSPREVLGWLPGRRFSEEDLARLFVPLRYGRRVDPQGYVRFRHWRIYGERGVSGRRAFVWLAEEYLTVQFAAEPLAQYRVTYARDHRGLRELSEPRVFATQYRSPQPPLLELRTEDWRLMFRLPDPAPRRRRRLPALVQLPLLPEEPPRERQG
jgi:transposase InsO family protein